MLCAPDLHMYIDKAGPDEVSVVNVMLALQYSIVWRNWLISSHWTDYNNAIL